MNIYIMDTYLYQNEEEKKKKVRPTENKDTERIKENGLTRSCYDCIVTVLTYRNIKRTRVLIFESQKMETHTTIDTQPTSTGHTGVEDILQLL